MICQRCGHLSPALSPFCTKCGQLQQPQAAFATPLGGAQTVTRPVNESVGITSPAPITKSDTTPYASFLKRFVAFLIDQFIAGALAAVTYFIMAALGTASGASSVYGRNAGTFRTGASVGAGFLLLILGGFLAITVYVYYFVKQETVRRQATLGKSLLGLRVTTTAGSTLSVGQSVGRLIIKDTLSGLFFALGFVMAAFTERKQALHDFIAGTIVVRG